MKKSNIVVAEVKELSVADKLYAIQREIALLQEDEKVYKEELLKSLKKQRVKSLRLEDGSQYIVTERQTLKVKDEDAAWDWAMENPKARLKIDTGAALTVFRREIKMPKFFGITKAEYLTVKHGR